MSEQRIIRAEEAPNVRVTKTIKMSDIMEAVERRSNSGYGSVTYDVRYEAVDDEAIKQLKELGYRIELSNYATSAFITITWETDDERKQRIQDNIPPSLRS